MGLRSIYCSDYCGKRINQISLKLNMVNFLDKFSMTEFEKLHTALDNDLIKILDPEGLILKDNFTLVNIDTF